MSVIRFFSGPVKFTLGWLDGIDKLIRKHLTEQGMSMKRGMSKASSSERNREMVEEV